MKTALIIKKAGEGFISVAPGGKFSVIYIGTPETALVVENAINASKDSDTSFFVHNGSGYDNLETGLVRVEDSVAIGDMIEASGDVFHKAV